MNTLEAGFASYAAYHRTPGNKISHTVGIPLIVYSTFGMLSFVVINEWLNLGLIAWLLSSLYYCKLDLKRGLGFSVVLFIMYYASLFVSLPIHIGLFVFGWILQGIGHYVYEKKSPAFLTNLSHLLIGPFWIFCNLIGPKKPTV